MSKIKLTGTELSSSLNSTGSFGRLDIGSAIDIDVNSGQGQIGMSSDAQRLFLWGGSNRAAGNGAYIQMDGTNLGGSLNLFAGGATGSVQVLGNLSGSLGQTGSFSGLRIVEPINGSIIEHNAFGLKITGGAGYYPLTVTSPYETAARFLSSDGTSAIEIGDNSSTTDYNKIQVVGNDRMEFYVNNTEMMELQASEITINQGGANINTRIEGDNDENLVFIDAGTNKVGIGKPMNNGDEKFYVGGDVGITGSLHVSGNISTSGSIIAKEFRTEFINQIIATSSGSTEFGDDTGDVHRFTGSLNISASAGTPAIQIGTGNIVRTGIKISDNRAQFGYDGGYAVVQGGGSKGVKLEVNNDTFGSGTEAVIVNSAGNVGIGATEANIATRLEVQQSAGTPMMQIRPSDASTDLNPLIMFRSQLNGTINYLMAGNGGHLYFATYDSGTPTDVSKMIRFSPDATLSPKMFMGDDGSAESTFRVGGPTNGVFVKGGASGSLVSGSLTSTGSFGNVKVAGNLQLFDSGADTTQILQFGNARDLQIYHNGTNSFGADNYTGHLIFQNRADDSDIIFKTDDGSGGVTTYLTLDGSETNIDIAVDTTLAATKKLYFDGGTHTFIEEVASDQLRLVAGGTEILKGYAGGTIDIYGGSINRSIELGANRTGDAASYIDFIGDTTYTDYGFRVIRNSGANAITQLLHRGTGELQLTTQESAPIRFRTSGSDALMVNTSQNVGLKATGKLFFDGVDGSGHTYIHESANDQLDFYVGAQHMLRMYEGGTDIVHTNDNVILGVGNDPDLELKHDGTDSFISNDAGDLYIESRTTDKDIIFRSGSTNFITIDGSSATTIHQRPAFFGTSFTSATTTLHVSSSGVNGILIDEDGANNDISSRLLFREQNSTIALYNTGDTFSFRTGATVNSTSGTERFQINGSGQVYAGGGLYSRLDDSNTGVSLAGSDVGLLQAGGNEQLRWTNSYGVVINEGSNSSFDFRVESNSQTHALFVNSGEDSVGIFGPSTGGSGSLVVGKGTGVPGGILLSNGRTVSVGSAIDDQFHPVGHYSTGEEVFSIDPTWSDANLSKFFNMRQDEVFFTQSHDAPGGYAIKVSGAVSVGGPYDSGFPYIPIDSASNAEYYMECWIKNVGTDQRHYMGSNEYDQNFSSTGGNPGSYGYFVMSNYNPGNDWTYVSGYISGSHISNAGNFETSSMYWGPLALFNYGAGSGERACLISGWKITKTARKGRAHFQDGVAIGIDEHLYTVSTENGRQPTISNNGSYTMLRDPSGTVRIYAGDSSDQQNYYDSGAHRFRGNGGSPYLANLNSTGLFIGNVNQYAEAPLQFANNVAAGGSLGSSAPFDSFTDYQILLFDTGDSTTSYGLGITDNTMIFNSDSMYAFYSDNSKRVVIDNYGMQISGSTTSGRGVLDIEVQNGTYSDMDTAVRITNTHAEAEAGLALNTTGDALASSVTNNLTYDDNNPRQPNSGRTSGFITFVANATSGTNSRIALGGAPEGGNVTSAYMPDRFILDFDGDTKVVSGSFIVSESIKMNVAEKLYLDGGGDTYMHTTTESSNNNISFVIGGNTRVKMLPHIMYINSTGANGLVINNDEGTTTNSGRIFFEGNTTTALMQEGDDFSIRTGATSGTSSGTEKVRIHSSSIEMSTTEERLELGSGAGANYLRTSAGYLQLGPLNSGGCHIYTDREQFYFNNRLTIGVSQGHSIIRGYNPPSTGTNGDIGFDRASNNIGRRQFLVKSGSTDHLFNGVVEFRLSQSGDFHADGDVIAASTQISSDKRLKENIEDLPYGLNEVIKLRPVEFNWIKEKRDGKHDIGVIAQEVENIIPEIVKETLHLPMEKNYKSVDYAKLAVVLVNAVKEQQEQIDELKEEIKKLKE